MKRRVMSSFFSLTVVGIMLWGCKPSVDANRETIVLISIDGMRWDYYTKAQTPNLDFLIRTGVRAKHLISCFPTKTFPNHYTIATGLYPEEHGIIANNMQDAELGVFDLDNQDAIRNPRWWGGEPIWVTAEKQGQTAACYFWPGSETAIDGVLPTYWYPYDHNHANEPRIEQILAWLELPLERRPTFITTYFSFVDDAGHDFGPDSPEVSEAVAEVDRLIGILLEGLKEGGLLDQINIIVLSDHGCAELSLDRAIFIDDYIDLNEVEMVDWNPVAAIRPLKDAGRIYEQLVNAHPHLKVYWREQVPERFRYRANPRITEIVAVADEGWSIITRENFRKRPDWASGGTHGYDNELESMGATFIARGPAFKSGLVVEPFLNIHIYNLMAEILGLEPAPNSGDLDVVKGMLRESAVGEM